MTYVSIPTLSSQADQLIARAARGEEIAITRDGSPVAELRAISHPALSAEVLLSRHRHLPQVDARALREDIDRVFEDPFTVPLP
jgi:antitoxin (DNA-binding transcriptional repressor) of toxin-antitoxin stability system